ncbi:MAG: hypothetical protein LAP39_21170 [Acidobacteriia bacterium]|nr:hypothetical protein [Terriglobia bacterium]
MMAGDIVFVSASVPYRPLWTDDAKPVEIEEAIVSIARAVFARKGRLLFGGHPSVSPLIASIAGEYFPADPERRHRPVITFQSEYFRGHLPDETWQLFRMGWSSIQWTPAVPGADGTSDQPKSLKLMREWMLLGPSTPPEVIEAHGLRPPKAMLAVGGMEGVADEAGMFLSHRIKWRISPAPPIYAITSGGGAARRLAASNSAVLGLEQAWREKHPNALDDSVLLEPYAAMTQWLMDMI